MKKNCFTTQDLLNLPQSWPLPREKKAIDIIAAGGIVKDAHLPAYRKAGFPVSGIYDSNPEQARERAEEFDIPRVYESLEEAVSQGNVIDLATPPEAHLEVLEQIPQGRAEARTAAGPHRCGGEGKAASVNQPYHPGNRLESLQGVYRDEGNGHSGAPPRGALAPPSFT